MKKILFIVPHRPGRSPAQRFRFEQFLDYFKKNGFSYEHSHFISDRDDKHFYRRGAYFRKIKLVLKAIFVRLKDISRASEFDIIFIQREAFMLGTSFFERGFRRSKAKLIYDFDDSIWLGDTSDANKKFRWLKYPGKIANIIALSDMVFAGNKYLANYASYYNTNVRVVPTTIDTDVHKRIPGNRLPNGKVCIGWTGSMTTIKHFEHAVPVLKKLKEKYGDKIEIRVIGDESYGNDELGIKGQHWDKKNEIRDLSVFDIGIMPLPNDEWTKGKCGLKGLQYMSLEIPAIMSPVGVNTEIINDGVNGFLADKDEEWVEKLSILIEDSELRKKIGQEARKTVLEKYSKNSEKDKYIQYFNEVLAQK